MVLEQIIISAAVVMFLSVAGDAAAVTLTNRDSGEHRLQITEGDAEDVIQEVVMSAGQTRDDLCESGCLIMLENGSEELFDGYETIFIQENNFVIAD